MNTFKKADILVPQKEIDYTKWSVVACDQYTSQPDYWERVKAAVGTCASTLNLVYPEMNGKMQEGGGRRWRRPEGRRGKTKGRKEEKEE